MNEERMMKWFEFGDSPAVIQEVVAKFWDCACQITATLDPGPERTVALRKLLEARDAAVRAKMHPGG